MKDFAGRLRMIREARGLSQRELAEVLGIHVMQINRYERGLTTPSATTILQMASVLQVTTDELLAGEKKALRPPEIRDIRLLERFRALDDMPREEREVVVHVVDAIIAKHRVAAALQGEKRPARA